MRDTSRFGVRGDCANRRDFFVYSTANTSFVRAKKSFVDIRVHVEREKKKKERKDEREKDADVFMRMYGEK